MGKRRRPTPQPGQSTLPFVPIVPQQEPSVVEIPLEQAVKIGKKLDSCLFSETDSEFEWSGNGGDTDTDDEHGVHPSKRQLRSPTTTKRDYRESSSEEDDHGEEDDCSEYWIGLDDGGVDEDGRPRTNDTARVRERAPVDREEGKLIWLATTS